MPRDVGSFDAELRALNGVGERVTLGAALRAKRQSEGLSLESIAQRTRVRRAYLQAVEDSNWAALPPGPYACGYVRLYAEALGLNGQKAVAALKEERPASVDTPLPSPIGIAHQDRRSLSPLLAGAFAVVAAAVLAWNVVQRATPAPEEYVAPPYEADAWRNAQAGGVVAIGAPTPPPPDQNAPAPYETPGLAAAMQARDGSAGAVVIPAASVGPAAPQAPVGAAFNPRAAIHGALPQDSRLTVQAREAASIVVRRRDGSILFARQLAAGEAYRAPAEAGLVLDVSRPGAFDVYRDGEFRGQLRDQQSRVDGWLG